MSTTFTVGDRVRVTDPTLNQTAGTITSIRHAGHPFPYEVMTDENNEALYKASEIELERPFRKGDKVRVTSYDLPHDPFWDGTEGTIFEFGTWLSETNEPSACLNITALPQTRSGNPPTACFPISTLTLIEPKRRIFPPIPKKDPTPADYASHWVRSVIRSFNRNGYRVVKTEIPLRGGERTGLYDDRFPEGDNPLVVVTDELTA